MSSGVGARPPLSLVGGTATENAVANDGGTPYVQPRDAGGGGGEPPDGMKDRIEKLEAGQQTMTAQLADISATLREISAKLDAKADTATLERVAGEMRNSLTGFDGRLNNLGTVGDGLRRDIDKLPSKFDVATILFIVVGGLVGIATLIKTVWPLVSKAFGS